MSSLLDSLNPEQLAAVTLPNQSALILAGAGSGKTRVLTTRIAWLIQTGQVSPQGILAVTFTNKAAKEMLTRLTAMLPINTRGMWIGTFHGLCNRMLRAHHRDANLPQTFQILDTADQLSAIKRLMKANSVDDEKYPPRNVQYFINNAKESGLRAGQVEVNDDFNRKFVELYRLYDEQCQREGVVDFPELLLRCHELLVRNEPLRAHYNARFSHILVDEFQDTNVLQYQWLKLLAGKVGSSDGSGAIFAVGDDDQCVVAGTQVTMADGSRRPIEQIRVDDMVRSAVGGGRIGGARVTKVFERQERIPLVTLTTQAGRAVTSTLEHVHFAGYTVGHLPAKYFLHLMNKPGVGYRLAVSGHRSERSDGKTVPGFRQRARQEGGEQCWVIDAFDDEVEAREKLNVLSLKYGLPTRKFVYGEGKRVPAEFSQTNTERAAQWLLKDINLAFDHPAERRRPTYGTPGDVLVSLCSDSRRDKPDHRVYARIATESAMQKTVAAGFQVHTQTTGTGGWYVQFWRRDYGEAVTEANKLRNVLNGRVLQRARLGKGYLPMIPAQYVRPGMAIFDETGEYDIVAKVETLAPALVTVYDLNIEGTHNFAANGLLTHNSIYAFRGANVGNMADFEREFRVRNVIKLEQNYRSHGNILDAANALIRNNAKRLGKELWTDAGHGEKVRVFEAGSDGLEAAWMVDEMRNLIAEGSARSEIAVLYRSNAQSRVIEHALFNAGIAYRVYGGLRFFERAEIKHALAYLRLVENPADDTAFSRVVNFPPRGIGARSLEQLADVARTSGQSLYAAVGQLGGAAGTKVGAFVKLIEGLRFECQPLTLKEIVQVTIERSGLVEHYRSDKEGQERIENLEELVNAASAFVSEEGYTQDQPGVAAAAAEAASAIPSPLAGFLSHASLEAGDNQAEAGQDALQLMTVHAAKGLEFSAVFITGLEEGLFPHMNSVQELDGLEEERRLMYVAITRARKRLYLSFAQSRMLHGQTQYNLRSRFLEEIPDSLVKWLTPRLREGQSGQGGGFGGARGGQFGTWGERGAEAANTVPARTATSQTLHGFRVGQSVRHAKFGDGVIVKLEGSGSDARAKINFGPHGMKELALAIAKLQAA
ncbi:MAG: UvrD-helicase domain-containing protein [Burkholderiaceae bacterium]|nr:UvrD-helicase domain-containing protein [Burkholderiaceae bacterium]